MSSNQHSGPANWPVNPVICINMRAFAFPVLVALLMAGVVGIGESSAATAIRLTFDRPLDASFAPFLLAANKGFFRDEDLSVTTDIAKNTTDAIARVAAGETDVALADINALARYRDGDGAVPVKAIFVFFNRAPYALIARRSRGVNALADVEGKILGVAQDDLAIRFWPAVARLNGIKLGKIKVDKIGSAVREPMLSAGQVDAVTGFSYLAPINLRNRGIPANDLMMFRFSDYGSDAYGSALIVNPKFAADRPDAVRGLVRAVIAGLKLTARDPNRAVDDIVAQIDGANRDLEFERLRTVMRENILTDEVKRNGFGGIDDKRFASALAQLGEDLKSKKPTTPADLFDASFLPAADMRRPE